MIEAPDKKEVFIVVISGLFLLVCAVARAEVSLSTNQTDYYFLIGENAGFLIDVNNTFDENITGVFSFTVTQNEQSGNMQRQSSNSRSQNLMIERGTASLVFDIGPQQALGTLIFQGGSFEYTGPDDIARIVTLEDITVHIVEKPEEKQESEPSESESKTEEERAKEQQEAREQAEAQREEELRKQMQQQQEASKTMNKVQNNQVNQNTNALKQEMQEQLEQEAQSQERMQQALQQSQEFQESLTDLLDEGYNVTGADLLPGDNGSGDFEVRLENQKGDQAKIEGKTQDQDVTEIDTSKELSMESMLEKLNEHPDFQKFDRQLKSESFNQSTPSLQGSDIKIEYTDEKNKTATITASFNETEIEEVELSRDRSYWPYIIPLIILVGIISVFMLRKKEEIGQNEEVHNIDYHDESLKMLALAKKMYQKGKKKDAYGKVGEAVRFFTSHDMGLAKELTNNQVLREMKKKKRDTVKMKECLSLCSLVEFARYTPNSKDFGRILNIAEKIIR